MTDLIIKLVTDHGLAAVLGLASLGMQFWVASKLFTALSDQNRALGRLLEQNDIDTVPPPSRHRRRGRLMPRAPTPPPFFPVPAAKKPPEGDS